MLKEILKEAKWLKQAKIDFVAFLKKIKNYEEQIKVTTDKTERKKLDTLMTYAGEAFMKEVTFFMSEKVKDKGRKPFGFKYEYNVDTRAMYQARAEVSIVAEDSGYNMIEVYMKPTGGDIYFSYLTNKHQSNNEIKISGINLENAIKENIYKLIDSKVLS
jgi:hypothetical protein